MTREFRLRNRRNFASSGHRHVLPVTLVRVYSSESRDRVGESAGRFEPEEFRHVPDGREDVVDDLLEDVHGCAPFRISVVG